jgi:F-type H+-transporting ATPase subunit a
MSSSCLTTNVSILSDPLEQFEVESFFVIGSTFTIFFFIAFKLLTFFYQYSLETRRVIPKLFQSLIIVLLSFIKTLVSENISSGKKNYFLVIQTIFSIVLICNMIGMVPYSFTLTSHIVVTFFFSSFIFLGINYIAISVQKLNIFNMFLPSGTPLAVAPFLVVIETISYVARVFSLAIRLFANMMSGHTLLKILGGFSWVLFLQFNIIPITAIYLPFIPFLLITAVTSLEFVIAFLQAYVFTILTSIYLNDVLNLH